MKKLIFIGGIHGVGKTTICNEIVSTYSLDFYSASDIIANSKKEQFSSSKLIPDIEDNQFYLIDGIKNTKSVHQYSLLDGHLCLINDKREVSKIPEFVFDEIHPVALIIVIDEISTILKRLEKRDSNTYDSLFLEKFQNEELEYSRTLANRLNIPLQIYNQAIDSRNLLHEFITKLGVGK